MVKMSSDKSPNRFDPSVLRSTPLKTDTGADRDAYGVPPTVNAAAGPTGGDGLLEPGNLAQLGSDIARVLQDEGYHPVILFGSNLSGKTSILMSLFGTISSVPELNTGLVLEASILGNSTAIARYLDKEAQGTFHIKTQAFLAGEKIPKTNVPLPFFIPVEFRPPNGPTVKFAFLESNGEWYSPTISDGSSISEVEKLYPDLRAEIESFISSFQNGISFIYAAPVTQGEVYSASDNVHDGRLIGYASLAIKGVLQTYDKIRANARARDRHLLLLTKWDALSARETDRSKGIAPDHSLVMDFCRRRYTQALTAFQGLNVDSSQQKIGAYCAGLINERGLLSLKYDDELRGVIASYPVRLWSLLYKNALIDAGLEPVSPFNEPKKPAAWRQALNRFLDAITGPMS